MSTKYALIFERAQSNWAAYVPEPPVMHDYRGTLEETKHNILEAIQGHLETLRQFGEPITEPTSVAGEVEVTTAA